MRDEHGHPIDPCMAGHTEAVEAAGDICPECRGGITVRRGRVRPYRIACPGCGGSARGEDFRRIKALREDVEDGEDDHSFRPIKKGALMAFRELGYKVWTAKVRCERGSERRAGWRIDVRGPHGSSDVFVWGADMAPGLRWEDVIRDHIRDDLGSYDDDLRPAAPSPRRAAHLPEGVTVEREWISEPGTTRLLVLRSDGMVDAAVTGCPRGWYTGWDHDNASWLRKGPETGEAGRLLAEAALRELGSWPEEG